MPNKKEAGKKRIMLPMSKVCEGQIISHPLAELSAEYRGGEWLVLYINRDFKYSFAVNIIKLCRLDANGKYLPGMSTQEYQCKIPGSLEVSYYGYMEQFWKRGK